MTQSHMEPFGLIFQISHPLLKAYKFKEVLEHPQMDLVHLVLVLIYLQMLFQKIPMQKYLIQLEVIIL